MAPFSNWRTACWSRLQLTAGPRLAVMTFVAAPLAILGGQIAYWLFERPFLMKSR